jgi:hypothetical protein
MAITVYDSSDGDIIRLAAEVAINPECDPAEYAPAFAEMLGELHKQFVAAADKARARNN